MEPLPPLTVLDRASVVVAAQEVRRAALGLGFDPLGGEDLALAASELAQNLVDHAGGGTLRIRPIRRGGVEGLEIEARDGGPGLLDPGEVLAGTHVPKGLGAGLPTVRRRVAELDVDSRVGEGARVVVRRFVGAVRRHPELAALGRGLERPSGDHAWYRRGPSGLDLVVFDGVGHGEAAREAADAAARAVAAADGGPAAWLAQVDRACRGTRGVAATAVRWDVDAGLVTVAAVGNVAIHLYAAGGPPHAVLPTGGTLGVRSPRRIPERQLALGGRPTLVLHTDGVAAGEVPCSALLHPAAQIVSWLIARYAKSHDDALAVVVR